ncbi:MAG TPA: nucleotidyltransferase [Armatimonadota bacterium]|nr:nucleotidyltransferase [Armatimonadota bacterium]
MALPSFEILDEAEVYAQARNILEQEGIPFMVGGGQAMASYGFRRATKDIDFLLSKEDVERALVALEQGKFFVRRSDPRWICQALRGDVLVDLIFGSCTHRGVVQVTREWLIHAREMAVVGETFPVAAPEEIIGLKILAQHENRPDWWDAEMLLSARRETMDWTRIINISSIDPVKTLAFLLFLEARHPGEQWYPRDTLLQFWRESATELSL